ncbi:MAG TPA: hypothetical protein VLQ93_14955, partial [Myxococcaceae bacterium]|nr:hypothetical protein [Myxococcaceae bacterium]
PLSPWPFPACPIPDHGGNVAGPPPTMPLTPEAKRQLSATIRGLRERLLRDAAESRYRLPQVGLDEARSRIFPAGIRAGALLLALLTACAGTTRFTPRGLPPELSQEAHRYEAVLIERGAASTRPVRMSQSEFRQAFASLTRDMPPSASPREAALAQLQAMPELEGHWQAEVYRGRVLTLTPQDDKGFLSPMEAEAMREEYLVWCEGRGGGDCMGLLDDGPYLRADDRRTLALALAFASVLDESREALVRELLNPRAVVATLVWMAGLYLMTWLVPEPTTKGIAAVLTLVLVAWLGLDTVWGLVDGWARLAHLAHEARTFAELRAAGGQYAKVVGQDAARVLILGVAALTGRTAGDVAARVRSMPGYTAAVAQGEVQGMRFAVAVETVEAVVAHPEGALSVVMLKEGEDGSSGEQVKKRRGPKTDPDAPHNAKVRAEADKLQAEGNTIIAGGRKEKERLIPTPSGKKSGRRPDILYETPDGTLKGRNVGKTRADGSPVKREAEALDDLNGPGKTPTDFVPYDR